MIQGSNRVLRGGSWNNNATNVRPANRNNNTPSNRNNNIGFRLVLPAALERDVPKQIISGIAVKFRCSDASVWLALRYW
jgi:hypothetical protein